MSGLYPPSCSLNRLSCRLALNLACIHAPLAGSHMRCRLSPRFKSGCCSWSTGFDLELSWLLDTLSLNVLWVFLKDVRIGSEDGLVVTEGAPDFVDALFPWMVRNVEYCVSVPQAFRQPVWNANFLVLHKYRRALGVSTVGWRAHVLGDEDLAKCAPGGFNPLSLISFGGFHPRCAHASKAFWCHLLPKKMVPLRKRDHWSSWPKSTHSSGSQQWLAAPKTKNHMAYF